ncbi:MAG: 1-acyl-sn-glycerol-3-phosphate acyltransferase [Cytophagales bacterium]|nr:1-acyl-sn-glycerol-3-phosphate acyltransferase [Cytophagales bacterium]
MTETATYEDIRPYRDDEFTEVMNRLLDSPTAGLLIKTVFPTLPVSRVIGQLRDIKTIKDFQEKIIYKALLQILAKTSSGLTKSGLDNLDNKKAYLFISNHRDIILDPSILNSTIYELGFETAEIAIGDNLLETPWVKDLARLNKSFIVKRNLSVRELMIASKNLSNYIYDTLTCTRHSVWIAQREGRAKDGNDRTQPGLLTMLGMASKCALKAHFANLNIVPVSISYEHDPCDVDKARSLYAMKFFGGYNKEKNEDNLAMRKGILGAKGKIHIHFGTPVKGEIDRLPDDLHKNELIHRIGLLLDKQIIGNYKIQKSNQIAFDLLHGTCERLVDYSELDKKEFVDDIERKISVMAGEESELRTIFLNMYAQPYKSKMELSGNVGNSK